MPDFLVTHFRKFHFFSCVQSRSRGFSGQAHAGSFVSKLPHTQIQDKRTASMRWRYAGFFRFNEMASLKEPDITIYMYDDHMPLTPLPSPPLHSPPPLSSPPPLPSPPFPSPLSLLPQDIENYDPIFNPVQNHEVCRMGGRVLITLGDQDIDLSPAFTIFLSPLYM